MNRDKEVSQNLSKFMGFEKFLIVNVHKYANKPD